MKLRKFLLIILTIVITTALFTSCAEVGKALASTYLNLGEKYLTDLNYEEAIVYFNKLMEVEPKNERAYLGMAEAYVAMDDTESAIEILEQGIETVDDPTQLETMLMELLGEDKTETENETTDELVADEETMPEVEDETEDEEEEAEQAGSKEEKEDEETYSTSESQDEEDLLSLYDDILKTFYTALSERWNFEQLEEAGLNYLYCENGYELSEIGYAYIDLNGDGIMELLIGEREPYYQGYFIDLYTIVDGQVALIVSGDERSHYYLCEDGKIYMRGSSSAYTSYYEYYSITEDGKLSFVEAIVYDEWYDEENPYFYCTTRTEYSDGSMFISEENYIPITSEKASEIINSYTTVEIVYTPFSSLH